MGSPIWSGGGDVEYEERVSEFFGDLSERERETGSDKGRRRVDLDYYWLSEEEGRKEGRITYLLT